MSSFRATFIGDVARDEYYRADYWPGVGDKALISPAGTFLGGMVANAAVTFSRLGGKARFIGQLNEGPLSVSLLQELETLGVDTVDTLTEPSLADSKTIVTVVEGEHTVLIPELEPLPMVLQDEQVERLMQQDVVYSNLLRAQRLQHTMSHPGHVFAYVKEGGCRIVLDLDVHGFAPEDFDLLQHTHTLLMNQAGLDRTLERGATEQTFAALFEAGVQNIIVSQGNQGVKAFTASGSQLHVPARQVDVVDVTGAGDTFGGAFVYALLQGQELQAALRFATMAASLCIQELGPQAASLSLPRVEERL